MGPRDLSVVIHSKHVRSSLEMPNKILAKRQENSFTQKAQRLERWMEDQRITKEEKIVWVYSLREAKLWADVFEELSETFEE